MNKRAPPKAPPMMGLIGTFDSDFPCTETLVVGLDGEDSIEYNEEGDKTRELGVVDGIVVVELKIEVVRDDEGSLGRVPSLIVK